MSDSKDDRPVLSDQSEEEEKSVASSFLSDVPTIASPDPESEDTDGASDEEIDEANDEVFVDDTDAYERKELKVILPLTSPPSRSRGDPSSAEAGSSPTGELEVEKSPSKETSDHVFEIPKGRPPSATRSSTSPTKRKSGTDTSPRKREGFDLHSALAQSNAYHWGVILTNPYQRMYDELSVISVQDTFRDAEKFKRRARRESRIHPKMKAYMQAVSLYCHIADHYEHTLDCLVEAVSLYEYAMEELESGITVLHKEGLCPSQELYLILFLRFKAWLGYTIFMSKGMSIRRAALKASYDEFMATALSLEAMDLEKRPQTIPVSSKVLSHVADMQDHNDLLQDAVACWTEAEELAETKDHERLISACESAVDGSIAITSPARTFMMFVKETLCRFALYT